ncbi:hypothetical protein [Sphingomonas sp.]|uniref:hypothetical protein n=1 Tax=Sphingomonas sp. TaxID=28214 RepID=UPI00307D665C
MPSICDVPGCDHTRRRNQRLCGRCYGRLSGELRVAITEAHRQRRWPDWRDACRRAGELLNLGRAPRPPRNPSTTPQRAYELQARLLGERIDA